MMIKTKLLITITVISVAVAACGRGERKKSNTEARDTFTRSCSVCHGADGGGKPLGAVRAPSLKREEAMNLTDDQLFDKIYRGTGNMPSFKHSLTEEQVKDLVRFIREEIQGRQKPAS
jgi:mono/diheme cytochrome c family protein